MCAAPTGLGAEDTGWALGGRIHSGSCLSRLSQLLCPSPHLWLPAHAWGLLEKELMKKKLFRVLRKWAAGHGPGIRQLPRCRGRRGGACPWRCRELGPRFCRLHFPHRLCL